MSVNVPTLLQTVFRDVSMKTLSLVRTWPGKASFDSRNIAGAISNIRLVRRLEAVLDHRNIRPVFCQQATCNSCVLKMNLQ